MYPYVVIDAKHCEITCDRQRCCKNFLSERKDRAQIFGNLGLHLILLRIVAWFLSNEALTGTLSTF